MIAVEVVLLMLFLGAFVAEGFKPHEEVSPITMFALVVATATQAYRIVAA
jgi:hypothetical protein